jgi:acetylornithine deacetylase/succinyl-diaminopimelate desuccinylase-like protein
MRTCLKLLERLGTRPTFEINGMNSGYTGEGGKSIIPAEAHAKISCRLVRGQKPAKIIEALKSFFAKNCSRGFELLITNEELGGTSFDIAIDNPQIVLASSVLSDTFNCSSCYRWLGSSIPVVTELQEVSKAVPVITGFGLSEDNIHAPNESFSWKQIEMGFTYVHSFLLKLKEQS